MGHTRLGTLPDTAPWRHVVGLIAEDADAPAVAAATTQAALKGLELAEGDEGLIQGMLLLSQIVLAARATNFSAALAEAGVPTPAQPGVFDVVGAFTETMDRRLSASKRRNDITEMAQLAAVESLTHLLTERSASLFGTTPAETKNAARDLSTQQGFGTLAHEFFSRFTHRFLTYHLGRELSNHVGGNGRFATPAHQTEFVSQLRVHCREACAIMRSYASGWYSRANFEGGVSRTKARKFVSYALTKLGKELRIRGRRGGH
jgi:hypothetical protein